MLELVTYLESHSVFNSLLILTLTALGWSLAAHVKRIKLEHEMRLTEISNMKQELRSLTDTLQDLRKKGDSILRTVERSSEHTDIPQLRKSVQEVMDISQNLLREARLAQQATLEALSRLERTMTLFTEGLGSTILKIMRDLGDRHSRRSRDND